MHCNCCFHGYLPCCFHPRESLSFTLKTALLLALSCLLTTVGSITSWLGAAVRFSTWLSLFTLKATPQESSSPPLVHWILSFPILFSHGVPVQTVLEKADWERFLARFPLGTRGCGDLLREWRCEFCRRSERGALETGRDRESATGRSRSF